MTTRLHYTNEIRAREEEGEFMLPTSVQLGHDQKVGDEWSVCGLDLVVLTRTTVVVDIPASAPAALHPRAELHLMLGERP